MIVVGTYLIYAVERAYKDEFIYQMKQSVKAFSEIGIEKNISEDSPKYKDELFKAFKYIFAINNISRKGYLLNEMGKVILASDPLDDVGNQMAEVPKTPNILAAMNGKIGDALPANNGELDYAKPILRDGKVKYILYVRYNKEGLKSVLDRLKNVIFYSVIAVLGFAVLLGYLLAQAITGPISNLTNRAEKIASGIFEPINEIYSDDELGKLIKSFNYMSQKLKHTLDQISDEKNKIETLLFHMTDGVMAFDLNGNIIHANPAAKKMLDLSEKDDFNSIIKCLEINISMDNVLALKDGATIEQQVNFNDKYYKIIFVPFKSIDGKANGIITVIHDITEQQKLENMRREFVANVSHELKTPLTSIKTYTETLLDGGIEDKELAIKFLNVVNSESDRMSRIVSDLLQLSRIDYKETRWNKTYFDLEDLVNNVIQKLKIEADKRQQHIECIVQPNTPKVFADKDGIEQVIINIISNSIKYTPEKGKIRISISPGDGGVYLKVVDNGIGIPPKDLPRIFERFYRVDKARSRELGGTGLGLSIAKEIVEANEGTISIDSTLGEGTEVTIWLPETERKKSENSENKK